MRRREVIGLIGGAVAWPLAGRAQPSGGFYRVVILTLSSPAADLTENGPPRWRAFFRELRQLGYEEARNLAITRLSSDGMSERHLPMVREAIGARPDVIFAVGLRFMRLLKDATVPVVGVTSDPVGHGLVASLAEPGGNMTGVSLDAGIEIVGKRIEFLREITPHMAQVGYLAPQPGWEDLHLRTMRDLAHRAGISLVGPPLQSPLNEPEYRRVIATMARSQVDALFVSDYGENYTNREVIAELAIEHRLPTIHPYQGYVDVGGLMEYAIDFSDLYRQAAGLIDRVLNGQSPATLPFRQPTKFVLRLNASTAKKINLEIPPSLLLRADEVIE